MFVMAVCCCYYYHCLVFVVVVVAVIATGIREWAWSERESTANGVGFR